MSRLFKQFAIASLALTIAASNANAGFLDGFFNDLFGPMNGGPRHQVKIRGAYNPGDIIVSFGDRRLYYIEFEDNGDQLCNRDPKGGSKMVWRELCQPEARKPDLDADC